MILKQNSLFVQLFEKKSGIKKNRDKIYLKIIKDKWYLQYLFQRLCTVLSKDTSPPSLVNPLCFDSLYVIRKPILYLKFRLQKISANACSTILTPEKVIYFINTQGLFCPYIGLINVSRFIFLHSFNMLQNKILYSMACFILVPICSF